MTERKTPRNTTELPISVAIEKLRGVATERQKELDEAIAKVTAKVYKRFDERTLRITLRVPEELRQHVIDKAGLGGEVEIAPRAIRNDAAPEAGQGGDDFPEELPPGAQPLGAAREERIGRLTGAKR